MFETNLFRWIAIPGRPSLTVDMGLEINPLTALLLGNVLLVIVVVLVQLRRGRQRSPMPLPGVVLLSLFAAAMLLLATNILELLLFWQMTALCGFLLSSGGTGFGLSAAKETPGFRTSSSRPGHRGTIKSDCPLDGPSTAARRTLLLQLGTDLLWIPGLYLLWTTFGTLEIGEILGRGPLPSAKLAALLDPSQPADLLAGNRSVLSVICLCLLAAAVGRCGLFPLFRRRDDLTGGSAAVQTLIQSAVVMPAGLHLIVRWHRLFTVAPVAQTLMLSLGGVTAVLAALIAVTTNGSRSRLAFVNTSLFGLMFVALGWGTRAGLLGAVGLLFAVTLVMAVVLPSAGDAPIADEDAQANGLPTSARRPAGRRRIVSARFEPLIRLCRQRFYLDTIGTYLVVLPVRGLAIACRLADRFLVEGLIPTSFRRLPVLVAKAAEPLEIRPAQFNLISLVLSTVVWTVLLLWMWR